MRASREATIQDRDGTSVRLLPLSKDPFQAPTERDMLPSERREFVRTHRTCVFGYGRQTDGPAMSIVYYIPADNETLIDVMMAVAERMSGEPVPAELRPPVKAVAEQENRVLMRCRPYATFVTP